MGMMHERYLEPPTLVGGAFQIQLAFRKTFRILFVAQFIDYPCETALNVKQAFVAAAWAGPEYNNKK